METTIPAQLKSLIKRFLDIYQKVRKANPFIGKTKREKLDYLNSLQYTVLLKENKDKFYLVIPEISIVVVSNNLDEAHKDLIKQKQDYFTDLLDCKAEDEIKFPRKTSHAHEIYHSLKLFIYKLLIICLLGGVTITISSVLIGNKIAEIPESIANISMVDIAKKIVSETNNYIVDVPEETHQERLEKLHELVIVLRPLVQELETLFTIPDDQLQSKDKE
tara:strand:- start:1203 stop:1859 length:657 start_codon:yes stop_codon:yes gene_type:complete